MRTTQRAFYRLCNCNQTDYAVESKGEPIQTNVNDDAIDYFLHLGNIDGGYHISLAVNGMLVGRRYDKRSEALTDLHNYVDPQIRMIIQQHPNAINSERLDKAIHISANDYVEIWKESHNGE